MVERFWLSSSLVYDRILAKLITFLFTSAGFKAAARIFDILLISEATVDKSGRVSTDKTAKF